MLIMLATALICLDGSFTNEIINEQISMGLIVPVLFIVFGVILLILTTVFLCESPCFKSTDSSNEKTMDRLQ